MMSWLERPTKLYDKRDYFLFYCRYQELNLIISDQPCVHINFLTIILVSYFYLSSTSHMPDMTPLVMTIPNATRWLRGRNRESLLQ